MKEVPRETLEKAYGAGRRMKKEYGLFHIEVENNRAMELAFLWGLLGYPFNEPVYRKG
jgi:hypothetical protein